MILKKGGGGFELLLKKACVVLSFICHVVVTKPWPTHTHTQDAMKQTAEHHQWVIERDCRAERQHQGEQGDLARPRHFTISLSSWWSNQSDMVGKLTPLPFHFSFSSLITLRPSWFTSPSQLNVDDSRFLFFSPIVDADESQFNGHATVYSEIKSIFRIVFHKWSSQMVLFLNAHFKRLNIKSKRQNEEEQAQTQIQHYFVFTYFDFQLTTVKQVHWHQIWSSYWIQQIQKYC